MHAPLSDNFQSKTCLPFFHVPPTQSGMSYKKFWDQASGGLDGEVHWVPKAIKSYEGWFSLWLMQWI